MKVTIEINGDNAAFYNEDERASAGEYKRLLDHAVNFILPRLSDKESQRANLRDVNGNKCGYVEMEIDNKKCIDCDTCANEEEEFYCIEKGDSWKNKHIVNETDEACGQFSDEHALWRRT